MRPKQYALNHSTSNFFLFHIHGELSSHTFPLLLHSPCPMLLLLLPSHPSPPLASLATPSFNSSLLPPSLPSPSHVRNVKWRESNRDFFFYSRFHHAILTFLSKFVFLYFCFISISVCLYLMTIKRDCLTLKRNYCSIDNEFRPFQGFLFSYPCDWKPHCIFS